MYLKPVRTIAPAAELVTLLEVKQHCRVELLSPDDDAVLTSLIAAATAWIDGYSGVLGRALINQTWKLNLSCWPACKIRLPLAPVSTITSIKYYDTTNLQQTLDMANYSLQEDALSPMAAWIKDASLASLFERPDAIEVLFVAGYGAAASNVPEAIRTAAKMLVATWFENREATIVGTNAQAIPFAVDALLGSFRRGGV